MKIKAHNKAEDDVALSQKDKIKKIVNRDCHEISSYLQDKSQH
jgi:hypothetical protein